MAQTEQVMRDEISAMIARIPYMRQPELGHTLRRIREILGLTKVDVMYETKQRDHKIGLIEKGEIDPRQSSVQRLVTFYTERAKGLQRVYETSGGQKSWRATGMALAA